MGEETQMTEQQGTDPGTGEEQFDFPEGTPISEMSEKQQAEYWRHKARKHESAAKSFNGGLSAADAKALKEQLEALQTEKLSADEKALKEAQRQAAETARAEADAAWKPKYLSASARAYAAARMEEAKVDAFLSGANLSAFVGEDGEFDAKKFGEYIDVFAPSGPPKFHADKIGNPRQQFSKPGAKGEAEAAKRFGSKDKT